MAAWNDFLITLATGGPNYYQVHLHALETVPYPVSCNPDGSDLQLMPCDKRITIDCFGAPRVLKSGIVLLPSRMRSPDEVSHLPSTRCVHISEIASITIGTDELGRILPEIKVVA